MSSAPVTIQRSPDLVPPLPPSEIASSSGVYPDRGNITGPTGATFGRRAPFSYELELGVRKEGVQHAQSGNTTFALIVLSE